MIRNGLWPRLQHLPRDARQRVVAGVFGSKGLSTVPRFAPATVRREAAPPPPELRRCRRRRRESCEGGVPVRTRATEAVRGERTPWCAWCGWLRLGGFGSRLHAATDAASPAAAAVGVAAGDAAGRFDALGRGVSSHARNCRDADGRGESGNWRTSSSGGGAGAETALEATGSWSALGWGPYSHTRLFLTQRLLRACGRGKRCRGQRSGWARASQVVGEVRGQSHVGELKGARGLRQPRLCAVAAGSEQARGGVGAGRVRRGVRARGGTPRGNASSDGELARRSAGGGGGGRSSGVACARCCVRRCWCGRRLSPRRKQGAARRRWARSGGSQMARSNCHRRRRRRLQWPCWRHWWKGWRHHLWRRKGWRRLWLRLPLQRGRCSDLSKLGGWRHRTSGLTRRSQSR